MSLSGGRTGRRCTGAITQRPVSKVLSLSPTVHLTAYVRSEAWTSLPRLKDT
ncbi:MAG: hypothetical protein ACLSAF_07725 [Intestinimonas sp.]